MNKKIAGLMLALLMILSMPTGLAQEDGLYQSSLQLLAYLQAGQEEEALELMDETMQAALKGQIALLWPRLQGQAGDFVGLGGHEKLSQDGFDVLLLDLEFQQTHLIMRCVFNGQGKLSGLFFSPGTLTVVDEPLPQGVVEKELTVDAGTGYPLAGKLCLPQIGQPVAGIVLVAGSGPTDMDEKVAANAPLRDLAWGLAKKGIATLRYDKRTLRYGQRMVQEGLAGLTVDEETALDAVAALQLLRQQPELSGKPVVLLGHSLGAMLASYIGSLLESAPDGYILLAGSPGKLWDISALQNLQMAADLRAAGDSAQAEAIEAFVSAQKVEADAISGLSREEALAHDAIFGMSAYYLWHMDGIDAAALHLNDKKPVLILQGEKDRQVPMEAFLRWKEKLASHPAASFKSYSGLNHLFGAYQGVTVPLIELVSVEYAQRTPVGEEVIRDIVGWVNQLHQ